MALCPIWIAVIVVAVLSALVHGTPPQCLQLIGHGTLSTDAATDFRHGRFLFQQSYSKYAQYTPTSRALHRSCTFGAGHLTDLDKYVLKTLSSQYAVCTECHPLAAHTTCSEVHLCEKGSHCYTGYVESQGKPTIHWRGCCNTRHSLCKNTIYPQADNTTVHTRLCVGRLCDYGSPSIRSRVNKAIDDATGGWTTWSGWGGCPVTCGSGTRTRTRQCVGMGCPGHALSTKGCYGSHGHVCPSPTGADHTTQKPHPAASSLANTGYHWGPWLAWTKCSSDSRTDWTCKRFRQCKHIDSDAHVLRPYDFCRDGTHVEEAKCDGHWKCLGSYTATTKPTTIASGFWSDWSVWSACKGVCGRGHRTRHRRCSHYGRCGIQSNGWETDLCYLPPCSERPGTWAPWSQWSRCLSSDWDGLCMRYRSCRPNNVLSITHAAHADCGTGNGTEHAPCDSSTCGGAPGKWGPWYGQCSVTCGNGVIARSRTCLHATADTHHGVPYCHGSATHTYHCVHKPCPTTGVWAEWTSYGSCSVTCGTGTRSRQRSCSNPSTGCVGDDTQTERCTGSPCPVNGGWAHWQAFHPCSVTCGNGTHVRHRTCTSPRPSNGGHTCPGQRNEHAQCYNAPCPVDGKWGSWSSYSQCSVTCGTGSGTTHRACNNPAPAHGGNTCTGSPSRHVACHKSPCPIDGQWGSWQTSSQCSVTCGNGTQVRIRNCNKPLPSHGGHVCPGSNKETVSCSKDQCPINGNWGRWHYSSQCSVSCGNGTMTQHRVCNNPAPAHGGNTCTGSPDRSVSCHKSPCPVDGQWGSWQASSQCSVTCGNGTQVRIRNCNKPLPSHGGHVCPGSNKETVSCSKDQCPINGNWGRWHYSSQCSVSCGNGTMTQHRVCNNPAPAHGGNTCTGSPDRSVSCHKSPCPVDGQWGSWQESSKCSVTCGNGTQERRRTCNKPVPSDGGQSCSGLSKETVSCSKDPCPVNGNWGGWQSVSQCSVTCGNGTITQHRACDHPVPAHGGSTCTGHPNRRIPCHEKPCPVDGQWGAWLTASQCTVTCGYGTQVRHRACNQPSPSHGGQGCSGLDEETITCSKDSCPTDGKWGAWQQFAACSVTCGGGTRVRHRQCDSPVPSNGGHVCLGPSDDSQTCSTQPCPVDGAWSQWQAYSGCSRTCGKATKTRTRYCNNPAPQYHGKPCTGVATQQVACPLTHCPVDGGWGKWSAYSGCSASCGNGTSVRNRLCNNPTPMYSGVSCTGVSEEKQQCKLKECAVNGAWGAWSQYSSCSVTCGDGRKHRTRICDNPTPSNGGAACPGSSTEESGCHATACPVDGAWANWSSFTTCSKTCGHGIKHRQRTCTHPMPSHGGALCSGATMETQQCGLKPCPIDGQWTRWSDFSSCPVSCGGGTISRTRSCSNPQPAHNGRLCVGRDSEVLDCNLTPCPVDGDWSQWTAYTVCSATCGSSTKQRSRNCSYPAPAHGGHTCVGDVSQVTPCPVSECPLDGRWSGWSRYGVCSVTCGAGNRVRHRSCTHPAPKHGGTNCTGSASDVQTCNMAPCPVDGGWTSWAQFSPCSVTCGGGNKVRTRNCTNPGPSNGGLDCVGSSKDSQSCSENPCPVNGGWSTWSPYSACSMTCGSGSKTRNRTCTQPSPANGGDACKGVAMETTTCTSGLCPVDGSWGSWSAYSACSRTCGTGTHSRVRSCSEPAPLHGGRVCQGSSVENSTCNSQPCPVDGAWNSWSNFSACSQTCGQGTQSRSRSCSAPQPAHGGQTCAGDSRENRTCTSGPCPVDGGWGTWSGYGQCTVTCGTGIRERTRQCDQPPPEHGGQPCQGPGFQHQPCTVGACPVTTQDLPPSTTTTASAVPGNSITCYQCDGPPDVCELAYSETVCSAPDNYCINEVRNNRDGSRDVVRRCGSRQDCHDNWYVTYSDDDKCSGYDDQFTYNRQFQCSFCCVTSGCNEHLNPPTSTLFTGR